MTSPLITAMHLHNLAYALRSGVAGPVQTADILDALASQAEADEKDRILTAAGALTGNKGEDDGSNQI